MTHVKAKTRLIANARGFSLVEALVTVTIVVILALGIATLMSDMAKGSARYRRAVARTNFEQQVVALYQKADLCTCNMGGATPLSIPDPGAVAVPALSSSCTGVTTSVWDVFDSSVAGGFPFESGLKVQSVSISNPQLISGNDFSATATVSYVSDPTFGPLTPGRFLFLFAKTAAAGPPYAISTCTLGGVISTSGGTPGWDVSGNAGVTASDFIGTTDDTDVIFRRNNGLGAAIRLARSSFGVDALPIATGNGNTAIGYEALKFVTTGADNTGVGRQAGASVAFNVTTGSSNTYIGNDAGPGAAGPFSKSGAIGKNAKVSANNAIILGGTSTDPIDVGVGVSAPNARLDLRQLNQTNADNNAALRLTMNVSPTVPITGYWKNALYLETIVNDSAAPTDYANGMFAYTLSLSPNAIVDFHGIESIASKQGSGTTQSVTGTYSYAQADDGTTTGLFGSLYYSFGNAVIPNMYGQYIRMDTLGGGPVTNRYGIYLQAPTSTATNDWGFYQQLRVDGPAPSKNHFAGNFGIGTAQLPVEMFELRPPAAGTASGRGAFIRTQNGPNAGAGGDIKMILGGGTADSGSPGQFTVNSKRFNLPSTLFSVDSMAWASLGGTTTPQITTQHIVDLRNSTAASPGQRTIATRAQSYSASVATVARQLGVFIGLDSAANSVNSGGGSTVNTVTALKSVAGGPGNTGSTTVGAYGGFFEVLQGPGAVTAGFGVYIGNVVGTNAFSLYSADAAAKSYFGGNVGIGTLTATERLHVVGNVRVQAAVDCTLGTNSNPLMCSSDIRLKKNVNDIQDPLAKILSLRGVEFDWNEKGQTPGRHDIGVIAQEVEKVFPTAAATDSKTGFKRVDYAVLVAPIIQALKELSQKVQNLFGLLTIQNRKIASLNERKAKAEQDAFEIKIRLETLEKRIAQSKNLSCRKEN